MTSFRELQTFASYVWAKDGVSRDIASGSGETGYEPGSHRITNSDHDDGDRRRRLLGREGQHKIVGVETIRTFAVDTLYFGPTEARLNRAHNR